MNILINILIQILIFIGSIYIVGFIISRINALFYRTTGNSSLVCHATGLIGTPIHELSHALFCVIFLHKIEEIKLFQISDEDGTLGYVKHSYNRRNIYQIIGNFFIGVAPIVVGTAVLIVLLRFMVPANFNNISNDINTFLSKNSINNLDFSATFKMLGNVFVDFFRGFNNIFWWLYLLICLCIALHMNFSVPDFKGSLISLPFIIAIIAIANVILGLLFKDAYNIYLKHVYIGGTYLITMLMISLMFSILTLLLALLIRLIFVIIRK